MTVHLLWEQENWVQLLRPRSSQLKFKLPYHGPATYSYLKGDIYFQLFGKHSTSEVRLMVDAPSNEGQDFPRFLYSRQDHEDSLYHHNFVTRMQHLDSSSRIRISYDQNAAHSIFNAWKDRALQDASISGISDVPTRNMWVAIRIKELDQAFDRALGLRVSEDLKPYLLLDLGEAAALCAAAGSGSSSDHAAMMQSMGYGILNEAIPKKNARRMWKKNGDKNRNRRNAKGSSSSSSKEENSNKRHNHGGKYQNHRGISALEEGEVETGYGEDSSVL